MELSNNIFDHTRAKEDLVECGNFIKTVGKYTEFDIKNRVNQFYITVKKNADLYSDIVFKRRDAE